MKARFLLALSLCCALALGACGGGDSDGDATANAGGEDSTAETAQVQPEIEKAVSAGVASAAYKANATEVVQVEVESDGDKATAEVKLSGGTLDGQSVEAVLSLSGRTWTLDELARFTDLDKPRLVKNYEAETKAVPENLTPAQVRCLTKEFAGSSQAKIEAMYLDQNLDAFTELGKRCRGV